MNKKERRVKLPSGKQRELILMLSDKFGSIRRFASESGISYSTMKNYVLEVALLPEGLFENILGLVNVKKESMKIDYLDSNWGASLGGKKGMATLKRKYPVQIIKWRKEALAKSRYSNTKKIKLPELNEDLAEFIGVYLGDGTMTKYFIRISGDYRYDLLYYKYLSKLVFELFGVKPVIRREKNRNTVNLIILSKNICSFLNENFNLKFGHKIRNKTIIPKVITEDERLAVACLRGLIDTDGSVSRRGRGGSQFCIQFTSHNKALLSQTYEIGKMLGIFTFSSNDGAGTNKWENIKKYFRIVGSSNLRHIVRFYERTNDNNIYQRDVIGYYQKDFYRNLDLPFKTIKMVQ